MSYPARRFITESERQTIFDRWFRGESQHSIARGHTSIQGVLSRTGGIRPRPRRRAARALSLAEREEVSRRIVAGQSLRWIASSLGRAPSTISREIKRNGGQRQCRIAKADDAAWHRAHRAKPLAASLKRKHQRTTATVLPKGHRPVERAPKPIECRCTTLERTT